MGCTRIAREYVPYAVLIAVRSALNWAGGGGTYYYHSWVRPSHPYNAGTGNVGFSPTRQTFLAPSAKRREMNKGRGGAHADFDNSGQDGKEYHVSYVPLCPDLLCTACTLLYNKNVP